jgi:hypothetical protein
MGKSKQGFITVVGEAKVKFANRGPKCIVPHFENLAFAKTDADKLNLLIDNDYLVRVTLEQVDKSMFESETPADEPLLDKPEKKSKRQTIKPDF